MSKTDATPRAKPGRKSKLSRRLILDVAIELLAAEGPDRLSVRRLALELNVTPRALYGHFASKDELEAAIVGNVVPPLSRTVLPDTPWYEQLRTSVLAIHDAIVSHPGTSRLFLTGSVRNAATNEIREHLLMLLFASGLDTDDVVAAVGSLSRYLLGCVAIEDERRHHPEIAQPDPLAVDLGRFPLLHAMSERYAERNQTASTRYGLELLIAGLRSRAGEPDAPRTPAEGDDADSKPTLEALGEGRGVRSSGGAVGSGGHPAPSSHSPAL